MFLWNPQISSLVLLPGSSSVIFCESFPSVFYQRRMPFSKTGVHSSIKLLSYIQKGLKEKSCGFSTGLSVTLPTSCFSPLCGLPFSTQQSYSSSLPSQQAGSLCIQSVNFLRAWRWPRHLQNDRHLITNWVAVWTTAKSQTKSSI